jgi:hypothetical protein
LTLSKALAPFFGDIFSFSYLDSLPTFSIECGEDGIGTIDLGYKMIMVNFQLVMAFRDIPDARHVYEMIDRLRKQ